MSTAAAVEVSDTTSTTPPPEVLTGVAAEEATAAPCAKVLSLPERIACADDLIKKHALGAAGIGLIPLPAVDFVALTALQANLLRKLSSQYQVPFSEEIGKKVISALIGSYAPVAFAMPVASLLKVIPVVGQSAGMLAMSAVAGASTYAIGKVFVQHFESGGTFLTFDPAAVREYYREQFQEGREVVKKSTETAAAA